MGILPLSKALFQAKQLLVENVTRGEIDSAIENSEIIRFYYAGDETINSGWRNCEPYVLGYSRASNLVLRAFQLAGATDTVIPEWKLFRLDRMSNVSTVRQFTKARPNYNSNGDGSMTTVLTQWEPPQKQKKQPWWKEL